MDVGADIKSCRVKGKHFIAEDISCDSLHQIFYEPPAERLDTRPAAGLLFNTHIGQSLALSAAALGVLRTVVCHRSAGWQMHPQRTALIAEGQVTERNGGTIMHSGDSRTFDTFPKGNDMRIGCTPLIDDLLLQFFAHAHLICAEGFQGVDTAAVATVMRQTVRYGKTVMLSGISYVIDASRSSMFFQPLRFSSTACFAALIICSLVKPSFSIRTTVTLA